MRIFACTGGNACGEGHAQEKQEEGVTVAAKSWEKLKKGDSSAQETGLCPHTE